MGSRSITLKHTTRQKHLSPKSCIHNLFFHVVLIIVNKGQVALKSIIDQVSDLAIERQLICFLPSLFTAEIIYDLTDDQMSALAAEDAQTAEKRIRCSELLSTLHASMELKPLQGHRTAAYKVVNSTLSASFSQPPSSWDVHSLSPTPKPTEEYGHPFNAPALTNSQDNEAIAIFCGAPADTMPPQDEDKFGRSSKKDKKKKKRKGFVEAMPEIPVEQAPVDF